MESIFHSHSRLDVNGGQELVIHIADLGELGVFLCSGSSAVGLVGSLLSFDDLGSLLVLPASHEVHAANAKVFGITVLLRRM